MTDTVLVALVVGCEVGFWCFLGAGLATRYLWGRRRLSTALLLGAPAVDLVLLVASVLDLRSGGTAGTAHGLAAVYLGFSVGFGHRTVRWADQRFAHRFAGGPVPDPRPEHGPERTRYEWRLWFHALAGWAVACGLLGAAVLAVGDRGRTAELAGRIEGLTAGLLVWLVAWPVAHTIWPRRPPAAPERPPADAPDRAGAPDR